jgi:hypothetical protein
VRLTRQPVTLVDVVLTLRLPASSVVIPTTRPARGSTTAGARNSLAAVALTLRLVTAFHFGRAKGPAAVCRVLPFGLRPSVCDGSRQEIRDSERRGSALQVASVECVGLDQQDTEDIPPLPVRDFIAKAEPSQLL